MYVCIVYIEIKFTTLTTITTTSTSRLLTLLCVYVCNSESTKNLQDVFLNAVSQNQDGRRKSTCVFSSSILKIMYCSLRN